MIEIILSLCFFLSAVLVVILGLYNYGSRYSDTPDKDPFSFLNQFPYELQDNPTMKYSLPFRIAAACFGGLYAVFGVYSFFFLNMYGAKLLSDYILGCLFIVVGIAIFFEFVFTLKDYRKHLMSTSVLFAGTVVICAYAGFFILSDPRETYADALAYIMFVLAAALLASLLFTPLKKWMYLEKEESDGHVTYHRKRLSILPFMEWIFLAANVLIVVLFTAF